MAQEMSSTPRERRSMWTVTDVVLWLLIFGASLWIAPRAGAFGVVWAIFCAHRLAGSLALFMAQELPARHPARLQVAAGWLYFTRTLFWAGLLVGIGVAAIATHPNRVGITIGVLLLVVGTPFAIFGVQLVYRWRKTLQRMTSADTPMTS